MYREIYPLGSLELHTQVIPTWHGGGPDETFNKLTPQMERSMSHVLLVLNVGSKDAAMVETAKLKTSWFVSLQFRTQDI